MSWLFSQALVAEYSAANFSDTGLSALLNMTHTPDQYYWPDKPTEHSRISRFGMTLEPLTVIRGEDLLTWFLVGSRAKTSALQETGPDWTANGQGYGQKWLGLLAKYSPDTHSLKTAQLSLLEDLTGCCATLPRWGLLAVGASLEPMTLGQCTSENESGFSGAVNGKQDAKTHKGFSGLVLSAVWNGDEKRSVSIWSIDGFGPIYEAEILLDGLPERFFSERRTNESSKQMAFALSEKGMLRALFFAKEFASTSQGQRHSEQLSDEFADALRELSQQAALAGAQGKWKIILNGELYPQPMLEPFTAENESGYWPTATASARKGWAPNHNRANTDDRLDYTVERESFQPGQQTPPMRLNPDWVEWLMGWPTGQTALKPLETGKFREWQQQHSLYCTESKDAA